MEKIDVIEKFLRYVKIDTQSDDTTGTSPSTMKQHDLAKLLTEELSAIGASDVFYDKEHCYVYATIPSNMNDGKDRPAIGFVAHMDTSDEVSGKDVKPRIVEGYDGTDIVLNTVENVVLSPKDFPELLNHVGEDLIVTDGTTLLGADDKAGVSEIMTMAETLLSNPDIKHGEIKIAFTPDEEIGAGTAYFDIDRFGAKYAYTVDGGKLGELEYENFNAASGDIKVNGRSVHPGDAKNKMVNAALLCYEFHSLLPVFQNPMYTEKREGFFHLTEVNGGTESATASYIIRDHDEVLFEQKKKLFMDAADFLNKKYGEGTVEAEVKDQYYNMIEKIRPHMHLVDNAKKAMTDLGITPIESPIRGGTDGAALSYKGLPCPNLCTGGYNYHGKYEYASINEMRKVVDILLGIVDAYGVNY
ncbi:peptidase T [Butyrivibrio sp. VCB2006]|uniref:peptidase T n=1 Tax=Butyrivibrio sp. VCB2006 TaxID=1280679 RepID=UPI0003F4F05F|nr:peptidase T [Butyrivibrio sp. VCB2006]